MAACGLCGMIGTTEDEGYQEVCNVCGFVSMSQPINEVEDPESPQGFRRMVTRGPVHRSRKPDHFEQVPKETVARSYATALQICLMDHVGELKQMGINPAIEAVVRQIWFRVLKASKLLAPETLDKGLAEFREVLSNTSLSIPEYLRVEEQEKEWMVGRTALAWIYCLWHLLDLESIVWICYAACLYLQEAVSPVDMAMWIKEDKLPYMSLGLYGAYAMSSADLRYPRILLRPWCPPQPLDILTRATQLAHDIGLPVHLNSPAHTLRLARMLKLPDLVGDTALELHRIYSQAPNMQIKREVLNAHIDIGARIVIALKHHYGLDGRDSDKCAKNSARPPDSWVSWGKEMWDQMLRMYTTFVATVHEMDNMKDRDLHKLSQNSRVSLFSDCKPFSKFESCQGFLDMFHKDRFMYYTSDEDKTDDELDTVKDDLSEPEVPDSPDVQDAERFCISNCGVQFSMKGGPTYIPDCHLLPTNLYWFVPKVLQSNQCDIHLPIDFVSVVSVVSASLAVTPHKLLRRISFLEKIIWHTESWLMYEAEGKSWPGPETRVQQDLRYLSLREALRAEHMSEEEIDGILLRNKMSAERVWKENYKESQSIQGIFGANLWQIRRPPDVASQGSSIPSFTGDSSDKWNERLASQMFTSWEATKIGGKQALQGKINISPMTVEAFSDKHKHGEEVSKNPLINSSVLFKRARLAKAIKQPFITLSLHGYKKDFKSDFRNGELAMDPRGHGTVKLVEQFLSDVQIDSSDTDESNMDESESGA